jgi:hypothetical protein
VADAFMMETCVSLAEQAASDILFGRAGVVPMADSDVEGGGRADGGTPMGEAVMLRGGSLRSVQSNRGDGFGGARSFAGAALRRAPSSRVPGPATTGTMPPAAATPAEHGSAAPSQPAVHAPAVPVSPSTAVAGPAEPTDVGAAGAARATDAAGPACTPDAAAVAEPAVEAPITHEVGSTTTPAEGPVTAEAKEVGRGEAEPTPGPAGAEAAQLPPKEPEIVAAAALVDAAEVPVPTAVDDAPAPTAAAAAE